MRQVLYRVAMATKQIPRDTRYASIEEVAKAIGRSTDTVYRLINTHKLNATYVAGHLAVTRSELNRYLKRKVAS